MSELRLEMTLDREMKHYGFRELKVQKVALYHQFGKLHEPEVTQSFSEESYFL
jgi:hypothetical protein